MHIKRFRAKDVSSALEMVRDQLGHDAVILSTGKKRLKNEKTGRLERFVEVIAAVDIDEQSHERDCTQQAESAPGGLRETCHLSFNDRIREDILSEINELKTLINEKIDLIRANRGIDGRGQHPSISFSRGSSLLVIQDVFSSMGMEESLIRQLSSILLASAKTKQLLDHRFVERWLLAYIARNMNTGTKAHECQGPCRWAFVGPTGVGKTTTLAKIAARLKYRYKKNGLIVTVDTYRLGGIEQIQRYAQLMDIPLETAGNPDELSCIFLDNQDKDFIFVDTTGRNPWSEKHRQELARLFEPIHELKAQVLLCATSKSQDLKAAIECYKRLPNAGWIISKIDETRTYGPILTPVLKYRLPISYLTNGQRVPEDLIHLTPLNFINFIFSNSIKMNESEEYESTSKPIAEKMKSTDQKKMRTMVQELL